MMVIITYDVNTETSEGKRRLRHVAKTCVKYGQRVQNSVFECVVEPSEYVKLKHTLLHIIDQSIDSLRCYKLGANYSNRIEAFGRSSDLPVDDVMML